MVLVRFDPSEKNHDVFEVVQPALRRSLTAVGDCSQGTR